MDLSVLVTSLPLPLPEALPAVVGLGFACVDLVARQDRPRAECEALADSGLRVRCMALGRDLAGGVRLDDLDVERRRSAVEQATAQLTDAAQLGAEFAYLVPCSATDRLDAFTDSCQRLADAAQRRMMRLCVEPMPGSALASAVATLDWLGTPGLENVGMLLDVGHCLISQEEPAEVVRRAGPTLAYVHLDDNDGTGDLHWPLLRGRLTESTLRGLFAELRRTGFRGGIALELSPKLPEPMQNLAASKAVVMRL